MVFGVSPGREGGSACPTDAPERQQVLADANDRTATSPGRRARTLERYEGPGISAAGRWRRATSARGATTL